jgi:hypothetical protein
VDKWTRGAGEGRKSKRAVKPGQYAAQRVGKKKRKNKYWGGEVVDKGPGQNL